MKKRKIKEIAEVDEDTLEIIEETYAEIEEELINRIKGLQNQISLSGDKRNDIIRIDRMVKTAIDITNQSMIYMISIMAVEYLFTLYPNSSFVINWGNTSGYDIESEEGKVIGECFAAISYRSNGKLAADLKRLDKASADYKYEFFYDKEFTE